jgi:hypothetical protein
MRGLNIAHFKKVHEDAHSATLKHPKGHEIKISKKALSKQMKEELDALPMVSGSNPSTSSDGIGLADGGQVSNLKENYSGQTPKMFARGGKAQGPWQFCPKCGKEHPNCKCSKEDRGMMGPEDLEGYAHGGRVRHYEDGGDTSSSAKDSPDQIAKDAADQANQNIPASDTAPATVINIGAGAMPNPQPNAPTPMPNQVAQPGQVAQATGAPPNTVMPPAQKAIQMQQAANASPQAPIEPTPTQRYVGNMGNAFQQEANAQRAIGNAQAQSYSEQRDAADAQITAQQDQMKAYQGHIDDLNKERQGLITDIQNQHIDPNHFGHSLSTGQKVGTAIGLLLGGMGGGLTHSANPALQFLNAQIDRDISAQKDELGKKQNLLAANLRQFGNINDAQKMTNIMMNDIYANKIAKSAAQANSIIAKQNAQIAIAQLNQRSAMLQSQIAMSRMTQGGQGGAGGGQEGGIEEALNFARATGNTTQVKDIQERYLPGVGMANKPIPAEDMKSWQHLNNLQKLFSDSQQALQEAGTLGIHMPSAQKAKNVSLQNSIELELGRLEGLGRFTPEEAKRYKDMIPDLNGTHFTDSDKARIDELQRQVKQQQESILQSNGIRANKTYSAPQTKTVGGVTYKRGPNGEAIPVGR